MREFQIQPSPRGNPGALHVPVPSYKLLDWDCFLTFGGANTGMTGTKTAGYLKIGYLVYIEFQFVLTAKGSSTGNAFIADLPFPVHTASGPLVMAWGNMTTSLITMQGHLADGGGTTSSMAIAGTTAAATGLTTLTHADFSDTSFIEGRGLYLTAL